MILNGPIGSADQYCIEAPRSVRETAMQHKPIMSHTETVAPALAVYSLSSRNDGGIVNDLDVRLTDLPETKATTDVNIYNAPQKISRDLRGLQNAIGKEENI